MVGLYFACDKLPTKWGALFGFHADYLGGGENHLVSGEYEEIVERIGKHKHPQTWQPPNISPRVAAQHSQFVYSGTCHSKKSSIWLSEKGKSLLSIAISPKMKRKIIKILSSSFDIRGITLFPDLDGFCDFNTANFDEFANERW